MLPYTIAPGASLDVFVDFTAVSLTASASSVSAQNNQPSGNVPVLSVRGAGFRPPGGPELEVVVSPETIMNTDCACQAAIGVSAANIDVTYRSIAGGQVCGKPADPSCGVNSTCTCNNMGNYGDVRWGSAGNEDVRGDTWIIDEKITHNGQGADGAFVVRADLADDCLAVPGSTSWTLNFNCCEIDCNPEWNPAAPQACYDYPQFPSCASLCESESNIVTIEDCMLRGPVATRTSVHIFGDGFDETRDFCTTLNYSGDGDDVVTIRRQVGYFTIASVAPGIVEVAEGEACPAP